ncbi:MAG: M12 family metallo-peptidase [Ignavibacteriaceae bacterium]|nr:M12 family metallo-peptidase [Ignavibacteriaceae bacterium]
MKKTFFILLLISSVLFPQRSATNPWSDKDENLISSSLTKTISTSSSRILSLDIHQLKTILENAPEEFSAGASSSAPLLAIPLPDGFSTIMKVVSSPVMEPLLAARYPEIRTYLVTSTDNNAWWGRIDLTPHGFHGMIFTEKGTVFIDPYSRGNTEFYQSYFRSNYILPAEKAESGICLTESDGSSGAVPARVIPGTLRTYRLANACTGEYSTFHGGTVPLVLAAMVTSLNRINGVYEREVGVRMLLVNNNDQIIFLNASTDPYTNNNGSTMLGQNQTTCDNIIGSANYDIGHVYSTGGGGVAYLRSVCSSSLKAGGVTGGPSPVGDPFDIDYVAHEMGHQFGGNHTQNNSCQRNASTAFEPGSASTIMGYAGICSPNLQNNSDDYFHIGSQVEITNFINGTGNGCAVRISNNNEPPVLTLPQSGYTIPINTPFKLTGSATDPDNTSLTYCWEQYDVGPSGNPNTPSGNAPIFRSFNPVVTGSRYFPKLSDVYNNTQTLGEILPSYTRNLKFRFTVRDNNPGAGNYTSGEVTYAVDQTAGPFTVTYPNASGISVPALSQMTVTWNVANTTNASVNCQNVNILLTKDNGLTYTPVLMNTPNDGSQDVTIPDIQTTNARIVVEGVNNIFYDVSNASFSITSAIPVELTSFTATAQNGSVIVEWSTATETNNKGFEVQKKAGENFIAIGYVNGNGTSVTGHSYSYTDASAVTGRNVYRLKQIDYDGTFAYSPAAETEVLAPSEFSLAQNYPNPFNPATTISFSLAEASKVTLEVFDVLGNKIATAANGSFQAGYHNVRFDASLLNSGLYIYTLNATAESGKVFTQTMKMMLLK